MKWLADENFDNDIVRGLLRQRRGFDVTRVQDVGLAGESDSIVLEWATRNERAILTHDLSTMIPAMQLQLQIHERCTPVLLVPHALATGLAIAEILLLDTCSVAADWEAGVLYLPLR